MVAPYKQDPDAALRDALSFDPLAAAEKITGEDYKDPKSATSALGFLIHLDHAEHKRQLLRQADDSQFTNSLANYQRIIGEEGFKKALELDFDYDRWEKQDGIMHEKLFVYFQAEKGILLKFDTYGGDSINGGEFFYNWRPSVGDDGKPNAPWSVTSSGSYVRYDATTRDYIYGGFHDCREAIRFKIRQLCKHGAFVSPWVKRPLLSLMSHCDWWELEKKYGDGKYGHSDAITQSRIEMLPKHVRDCIG